MGSRIGHSRSQENPPPESGVFYSKSMPNMTGRPGYRTKEMNGGSPAPYLARTPYVPLFCTLLTRGGNRKGFGLPGAGGGSLPLYGGTFARSYLASSKVRSGKTDPVQFKKVFLNRALLAYKNGRFASSFLLLGIGLLQASKKANLSFKSPSPKPHLNRTGSVFALPIEPS